MTISANAAKSTSLMQQHTPMSRINMDWRRNMLIISKNHKGNHSQEEDPNKRNSFFKISKRSNLIWSKMQYLRWIKKLKLYMKKPYCKAIKSEIKETSNLHFRYFSNKSKTSWLGFNLKRKIPTTNFQKDWVKILPVILLARLNSSLWF